MDFSQIAKNQPSAEPGRFGRFYCQELINSGGMADIWVATDQDGKNYALRRLHKNLRFNFVARKRFFRGCEILSKIHTNEFVITYVEHGTIDLTPYLLMEYVEATNLKIVLSRQDPILAENLAQIIIDSALSLEHVHESGYMHLDFKPENILVTRSGGVRLVDFDLAQPKPDEPITMSKTPGTPAYMAPEQLLKEPFDARADIFSFGVMAYELLTGNKPFPGETPEEILRAELSGPPTNPREYNADIPAALEPVLLKCLKREPAQRYPYMSVVVRDLQGALYV
ncbi:MAG: Serine/threonine protein kinase [Verrucomicrobiales bacterium]|nr:Serine/threonine protein kinase [Verrucomicrobiales bacterium]